VIAPDALAPHVRERLGDGSPIEVISAVAAKGLEFDVAVVVEPDMIATRPGDLYVSLTRPTRHLDVVHTGELPVGLG